MPPQDMRVHPDPRHLLTTRHSGLTATVSTAKTHVARLLAKLDARDRIQLVMTAHETGLVSAPH